MNYSDQSIRNCLINDSNYQLKINEIQNPFYISNKNNLISYKDIFTVYKKLFVLCLKDTVNINIDISFIFNKIITIDEYESLKKYFVLVDYPINFLLNKNHYDMLILVNSKLLCQFTDKELDVDELVLPMIELKESIVKNYSNLYNAPINMKNISDLVILKKVL